MFKTLKKLLQKGPTPQGSFPVGTSYRTTAPRRGSKELMQAYNTSPWLRGVVSKVGHSVATTEWRLFAAKGKGSEKFIKHRRAQLAGSHTRKTILKTLADTGDLQEITEHPSLELLNGGNDILNGINNNKLSQIYLDLIGESFSIKERNALGVPIALWPVPPTWVRELPKSIDGVYKVTMGNIIRDIPAQDMVFINDPDPFTPYGRGSGIGKSLADEIDTDEFSSKFLKDFFRNSARPDIIISGDDLSPAETKRLENDWNNKNQGVFRRFRAYFVGKKIDVTTLSQDFKALKMSDLRKFERDIIVQVYGVPPEIMGIIENSNRATIDNADYIYAKWVLVPRLEVRRCVYQNTLIKDFDDRLILDYVSPVAQDKEHKLNVIKATPWAFRLDEIREQADYSELDNGVGEAFVKPFNMTRTTWDEEEEPFTNTQALDPTQLTEDDKSLISMANSLLVPKRVTKTALTTTEINALVNSVDAKKLQNAVKVDTQEMLEAFGQDAINQAGGGLTFNLQSEAVQEFINTESANRFATKINRTTQNNLRAQLIESVNANETIVQLTARVSDVFDQAVGFRARTIARTESVRISNFGAMQGMKQGGIKGKQWLSSRDGVVRDSHTPGIGLDGQIVAVNSDFKSPISGATGPHPGSLGVAEEDINCRCSILSILELKGKDFTAEEKIAAWKDFESRRMPYEKALIKDIRIAFRAQRKDVLTKLTELAGA